MTKKEIRNSANISNIPGAANLDCWTGAVNGQRLDWCGASGLQKISAVVVVRMYKFNQK
jgi:hypothetical protein